MTWLWGGKQYCYDETQLAITPSEPGGNTDLGVKVCSVQVDVIDAFSADSGVINVLW